MDILGIGNAILDIFWFTDDESSLSLGLHPNHSVHMTPERLDELLLAIPSPIMVSGGSASNSLKAAASLGAETAFIGCTGTDDRESDRWARMFREELASFGVEPLVESRQTATGRCLVIHMPGNLKAIACAPGAAPEISADQIPEALVSRAKVVLLDGQTLRNAAVTDRVAALCREKGIPLALDAGSGDVVKAFGKRIFDIMTGNDAILFLNDDESLVMAQALEPLVPGDRGILPPDRFIDEVFSFFTARKRDFPCIVQKRGPLGAKAWKAGAKIESPTEERTSFLDDTGAGDTFNGAFLAAWLKKRPLADCLEFSNAAALTKLSVPGTRLDQDHFAALKAKLEAAIR